MKPVMNIADVPLIRQNGGEAFSASMGQIGAALGATMLGCRLIVLASGKKAFPTIVIMPTRSFS